MRRSARVMAAASAAAITALIFLPTAASAHALPIWRFPAEGAVTTIPPSIVRVTFNEDISGSSDALRVVSASGRRLSQSAVINGPQVSARVRSLASGRCALLWKITSEDGHVVTQASGFAVRKADPVATPVTLRLSGAVLSLSGGRVGTRILTLPWPAAAGDVTWTHVKTGAPFRWTAAHGTARGMLPFPGAYRLAISVATSLTDRHVVQGEVTMRP